MSQITFWSILCSEQPYILNLYQQIPATFCHKNIFFPCVYIIYMHFVKDWKARMQKEVNLSKRNPTTTTKNNTQSRDLGKFKHNASTAGKEAVLGNMKIYRQDALWQSYLSFWYIENQNGSKSRNSQFTARTSRNMRAESKLFNFSLIIKVHKVGSWQMFTVDLILLSVNHKIPFSSKYCIHTILKNPPK